MHSQTAAHPARIIIDGDACPVKAEALRVAERHHVGVVIVSNGGLRPSRNPMVRYVVVPKSPDAADNWIAANVRSADIVVTADIPLAARAIKAGALALGPDGRAFTPDTIGMALAMRDLKRHLRETGVLEGSGRVFLSADRSRFLGELDRMVRRTIRNG
ncbi:MAG TPA: YaiI/YqxD family protein [Bauldia sp.]|nr:YaiI/YqxD family protein [Bauldia sp.]